MCEVCLTTCYVFFFFFQVIILYLNFNMNMLYSFVDSVFQSKIVILLVNLNELTS